MPGVKSTPQKNRESRCKGLSTGNNFSSKSTTELASIKEKSPIKYRRGKSKDLSSYHEYDRSRFKPNFPHEINSDSGTVFSTPLYHDPSLFAVSSIGGMWTFAEVAKAAKLLANPPIKVVFNDDEEMRRVYTLIYDVFRYSTVLNEALKNISFFNHNPETEKEIQRVWLLLFILLLKHFSQHEENDNGLREKLYAEAGVSDIDELLMINKVRLGAAIARMRIKNNALRLSQLLPQHLSDDSTAEFTASNIMTGWVNGFRTRSRKDISVGFSKLGIVLSNSDDLDGLLYNEYNYDVKHPHFIAVNPEDRHLIAQSSIVKNNQLILQSRSSCIGAAVFSYLLMQNDYFCSVIQTNIICPKSTAYLANILSYNNNIMQLLVFGAGIKKAKYDQYFRDLSVSNIRVFSQRLDDYPLDSEVLERVLAVFVSPPNSFSGVKDPIDLACCRGGDIEILETRTKYATPIASNDILFNQSQTLKDVLQRPQIQFVLYETHSVSPDENEHMVNDVVASINQATYDKYKLFQQKEIDDDKLLEEPIYNNLQILDGTTPEENALSPSLISGKGDHVHTEIPEEDLFEIVPVPEDACSEVILRENGCFLSLIRRKPKKVSQHAVKASNSQDTLMTVISSRKSNTIRKKKAETIERQSISNRRKITSKSSVTLKKR